MDGMIDMFWFLLMFFVDISFVKNIVYVMGIWSKKNFKCLYIKVFLKKVL